MAVQRSGNVATLNFNNCQTEALAPYTPRSIYRLPEGLRPVANAQGTCLIGSTPAICGVSPTGWVSVNTTSVGAVASSVYGQVTYMVGQPAE